MTVTISDAILNELDRRSKSIGNADLSDFLFQGTVIYGLTEV